jgi:cell division protein FtsW
MRSIRRSVFIVTVIMIMVGVISVYSSSAIYAQDRFGDSAFFLKKHLLFLFVGLVFMLALMTVDIRRVESASRAAILIAILLLARIRYKNHWLRECCQFKNGCSA